MAQVISSIPSKSQALKNATTPSSPFSFTNGFSSTTGLNLPQTPIKLVPDPKQKTLDTGTLNPFSFGNGSNTTQTSTPAYVPPTPTSAPTGQDVKSHTVKSDGTITQTYHPTAASPTGSYLGGSSVPAIGTPEYAQAQKNLAMIATSGNPQTGSIPYVAPTTPQNSYSSVVNREAGLIDNESPEVMAARQAVLNDTKAMNTQVQGNNTQGMPSFTRQGRDAEIELLGSQQIAADQAALANSLTSQGQGITALGNAQSGFAPKQNGYVLLDPTTGQPVGGGSAGSAAFQGGQVNAQEAQGAQQTQMTSALQQGRNLQGQLKDLITTFNLNPNDVNAFNSGLQAIAANTSSPQYQQLLNYMTDVASTYAQILTPGASTDTARSMAAGLLDKTAKGESIIDVMNGLDQAAQAKIAGVSTTGSSYGGSSGGNQFTGSAWK